MTSQQCDLSAAMLMLDQHYYDDAGYTSIAPTVGPQPNIRGWLGKDIRCKKGEQLKEAIRA